MSRRRCCCPEGCPILADHFDRGDSSDLGVDWLERQGDWAIDTLRLTEVGTENAVVVTASTLQAAQEAMYVSARVLWSTTRRPRIIFNFQDDDHYQYLEIQAGVAGTDWVIGKRSGIPPGFSTVCSKSTTYTAAEDVWVTIYVWFGNFEHKSGELTRLVAFSPEAACRTYGWWCCIETMPGGRRAGLGNGATTAVYFDDFDFEQHYEYLREWPDVCAVCGCYCGGYCVPRALRAVWTQTEGEDHGGPFVQYLTHLAAEYCGWHGSPLLDFCESYQGVNLELYSDTAGMNFELDEWRITAIPFPGGDPVILSPNLTYSTCHPFYLLFEDFHMHVYPYEDCGTWKIEITEDVP